MKEVKKSHIGKKRYIVCKKCVSVPEKQARYKCKKVVITGITYYRKEWWILWEPADKEVDLLVDTTAKLPTWQRKLIKEVQGNHLYFVTFTACTLRWVFKDKEKCKEKCKKLNDKRKRL